MPDERFALARSENELLGSIKAIAINKKNSAKKKVKEKISTKKTASLKCKAEGYTEHCSHKPPKRLLEGENSAASYSLDTLQRILPTV